MTKRRIALFAHYDRDGLIDDYVIYYLQGLRKVAECILFVSNCELAAGEPTKLEGIAELVFAGVHGTYDFGSWKRCFEHLGYDFSAYDEVIIANDSCYAPLWPFTQLFAEMETKSCDFWAPNAIIANRHSDHLSAYFMVFRCAPRMLDCLRDFFSKIYPEPDYKKRISVFERGLSQHLWACGFRSNAYITGTVAIIALRECLLSIPLLKIGIIRDNPTRIARLDKIMKKIEGEYPRQLIDNHLKRLTGTASPWHHRIKIAGQWQYKKFGLFINSKIKRNKHNRDPKFVVWKMYAYFLGIPFFAFVWPVRASNRR